MPRGRYFHGRDFWTEYPSAVDSLRRYWERGHSTEEIARMITNDLHVRAGDVTKNMVIGKAHRLKLPKRESPISGNRNYSAENAAKRKAKEIAAAIPPPGARYLIKADRRQASKLCRIMDGRWAKDNAPHSVDCNCAFWPIPGRV
jgi:hypothetical protein